MVEFVATLVLCGAVIYESWYAWLCGRNYWLAHKELVGLAYFEAPSSGMPHGKWWKTRGVPDAWGLQGRHR